MQMRAASQNWQRNLLEGHDDGASIEESPPKGGEEKN